MMRAIVVIALAAAAFDQRPPICTSIICNWRSFHNLVRRRIFLVVCRIGSQISLSQVLLLHEAPVEHVKSYFV